MSVHNEPGRGRKKCSACEKYVGVRSHACENCGNVFGTVRIMSTSSLQPRIRNTSEKEPRVEPPIVASVLGAERKEMNYAAEEEKTSSPESAKGSRIDRINYLKRELTRELKNSSKGYSAGVLKEISDAVLADWG